MSLTPLKKVGLGAAAVLLVGLIIGAVARGPLVGLWEPWRLFVRWKRIHFRASPDQACLLSLSRSAVTATPFVVSPALEERGCVIDTPVTLLAAPLPFEVNGMGGGAGRSLALNCRFAKAVSEFTEQTIIPLTQKYFGEPAAVFYHNGGFVCRNRRESAFFLSDHAFGEALDFGGVRLKSGKEITVRNDYTRATVEGQFLREVVTEACKKFGTVLGPEYNNAHRSHLHFGIGFPGRCSF